MENKTTIFVSKGVRDSLLSCKIFDRESHNEVIIRLVRFYKKHYVPVMQEPMYLRNQSTEDDNELPEMIQYKEEMAQYPGGHTSTGL